ncbi:MAG: AmmeMemoRadiSam system radical SAM enzyme [Candidatus Eremiobacterota bacterium]
MKKLNRRELIKHIICGGGACLLASLPVNTGILAGNEHLFITEAMYYEKKEKQKVLCKLCPNECSIKNHKRGDCNTRENMDGILKSLVYSRASSVHIDPVEKKPLFHYLPGTKSFSLGTAGCNFTCKFCQNWEISQFKPEEVDSIYLSPEDVIKTAQKEHCATVSCTYNEPIIFYEYLYKIARTGKDRGIKTVMISNGYINEKPMKELCRYLGGIKIDLKAFSDKFYSDICGGELEPVLNTLKLLKSEGMWFEIVVLIIPSLNDSITEIKSMATWIKNNIGPDVPLHFSRFHPVYKIKNLPSTPVKTLEHAREIALKTGLHYVYIGNVPGHAGENTYCPGCKKLLIQRVGFEIIKNSLKDGKCPSCSYRIAGIWK